MAGAKHPRPRSKAWTDLIHSYLQGRANLARVYVVIDARHGIKEADKPALELLRKAAVSHQVVLTKCDQLPEKDLAARVEEISAQIAKNAAAFPGGLDDIGARRQRHSRIARSHCPAHR